MSQDPSERPSGGVGVAVHTALEIKDVRADETANLRDPGLFSARFFCGGRSAVNQTAWASFSLSLSRAFVGFLEAFAAIAIATKASE